MQYPNNIEHDRTIYRFFLIEQGLSRRLDPLLKGLALFVWSQMKALNIMRNICSIHIKEILQTKLLQS